MVGTENATPPGRFAATLPVEGREGAEPFVGNTVVTPAVPNEAVRPRRKEDRARNQAKALRQNLTGAEAKLWAHLKRIKTIDTHFRKQVAIGPYIADFACLRGRLIVEVDGWQHALNAGLRHDLKRTSYLESRGFRVLRFWNDDVLREMGSVLDTIYAALHGASDAPAHSMNKRAALQDETPSSPSTGEVVRLAGPEGVTSVWQDAQVVEEKAERVSGDPTRPLRGHPPLKGEG